MARYRKKPVVIEAFQWTGDRNQIEDPTWIVQEIKNNNIFFQTNMDNDIDMVIETLEGKMIASPGDYIIKGVQGEIYPCKPNIFRETYIKVIE